MPFVITEPCSNRRDGACRAICPANCIEEGTVTVEGRTYHQMFINPTECIECGLCEHECPVDAIYSEEDLPAAWKQYADINAAFHRNR